MKCQTRGLPFEVMGTVIDLEAWRHRHGQPDGPSSPTEDRTSAPVPVTRLEKAIARLEPLVSGGGTRIGPKVETELLAITGAVASGRVLDAAARAERLAVRLEHPSSRAAR
jgi:hypothetical protein